MKRETATIEIRIDVNDGSSQIYNALLTQITQICHENNPKIRLGGFELTVDKPEGDYE